MVAFSVTLTKPPTLGAALGGQEGEVEMRPC